jgi:hypothetical protein
MPFATVADAQLAPLTRVARAGVMGLGGAGLGGFGLGGGDAGAGDGGTIGLGGAGLGGSGDGGGIGLGGSGDGGSIGLGGTGLGGAGLGGSSAGLGGGLLAAGASLAHVYATAPLKRYMLPQLPAVMLVACMAYDTVSAPSAVVDKFARLVVVALPLVPSRLGLVPSVNANHRLARVPAGNARLSDDDSAATPPLVVTVVDSSGVHSTALMMALVDVPKSRMLPVRAHTRTGKAPPAVNAAGMAQDRPVTVKADGLPTLAVVSSGMAAGRGSRRGNKRISEHAGRGRRSRRSSAQQQQQVRAVGVRWAAACAAGARCEQEAQCTPTRSAAFGRPRPPRGKSHGCTRACVGRRRARTRR